MAETAVVQERRDTVLVLRINRPDARNALNVDVITQLGAALRDAEENNELRAVVLTGTGDRAFCAGMDLRSFAEGDSILDATAPETDTFFRFMQGNVAVPVIGAANATALAGGFELLLACDVVVAAESAKFGLPEVKRGLFAAGGGAYLSNRIPLAVALELTLTGDPIDATRACALGLVNAVVRVEQVLDTAVEFAQRIAANGPLAVRATKQIVRAANVDMAQAKALMAEWQPTVFGSDDAKEGARAFVERRDPQWTGH